MAQFESKTILLNECISAALFITFQRLHYFEISPECHTELYLYRQMRRDYKIKFTDKSKANLWIHLDLAKNHRLKGLTASSYIIYLHFLNNILTLPHTFVIAEAGFGLTRIMFALFFACQIYTHACQFTQSKQMQAVY